MPTIRTNLTNWDDPSNWPDHGEGWSQSWGSSASMWHGSILPRIAPFLPAKRLVEIACGHGRVTHFLLQHCEEFVGLDLSPSCVAHCEERFSGVPNARFATTDGCSIDAVEGAEFVFSWDSLVHADAEALGGYVRSLARVLAPGGAAFLHHSNLGAFVDESGSLTVENQHWRDPGVSAASIRDVAAQHGLRCCSQELVQWGGSVYNDCFSLLRRAESDGDQRAETKVFEHPDMGSEMNHFRQLDALYRGVHA